MNKASHALEVIKNSQRLSKSLKGIGFGKASNQASTSARTHKIPFKGMSKKPTALRHIAGKGKEMVGHELGLSKNSLKNKKMPLIALDAPRTGIRNASKWNSRRVQST